MSSPSIRKSRPTSTNIDENNVQKRPKSPDSGEEPPKTPPARYSYTYNLISSSPYTPKKRVILNVAGQKFEILRSTVEKYPDTRLGKLVACTKHEDTLKLCEDFNLSSNEYFFERNPQNFAAILRVYYSGKIHFPDAGICLREFQDDLDFWGVQDSYLDSCCQKKYLQMIHNSDKTQKKEEALKQERQKRSDFGTGKYSRHKQTLWELLENPGSSWAARVVALISLIFTLMAVVSVILLSLPVENYEKQYIRTGDIEDFSTYEAMIYVCVAWFGLEWILRLVSSPCKLSFLRKSNLDLVDFVIVVVAIFALIFFELVHAALCIVVLRILRVPFLFTFSSFSCGIRVWTETIKSSLIDVLMILAYLVMAAIIFGTWGYATEHDVKDSSYISIRDSMWWAAATVTTVGYGDMIPETVGGKIVGVLCCFSGLFALVSIILVLLNNYNETKKRLEMEDNLAFEYAVKNPPERNWKAEIEEDSKL